MTEHHIRVQRTARYHMLGDPTTAHELWVVVHGYGQLARFFLNHFKGMGPGRCIVAPEGLSRFYLDAEHGRVGATWMTREDRMNEIGDHVAYLDGLVEAIRNDAPQAMRLKALGFSQGVATVARWATMGRNRPERLVLWAGGLPPELDRDALRAWGQTHVDLVLGEQDEHARPDEPEATGRRLGHAGISHRTHRFNGGHKLEPVLLERLLAAR